ncbi:branched-chain amino acid aminotransferase [uncultured Mucilaginibacter sp.]|uniref:branched-chain amino acid aminotransferase n=1 Tax=uncultured Mucilaginibacter sp. TaxID=797541 RepID=UPI0026184AA7|nr:branched-chain amino acid aminotransferase [uncultured Mucilaginibacter sp.]
MVSDTLDIQISKAATSRLSTINFENLVFGKSFSDHMLVADYADGQWQNFQILPYGEMMMSPAMSVLHYGQTFFEGLKAYKLADGRVSIFRPNKNAERFNKSAERLCMPQLPEDLFIQSIAALVEVDQQFIPNKANHSLYIRPFMFATEAALGVHPSSTYRFCVLTCPVGPFFSKNLKVKVETEFSRACDGGFGFAKAAGNYAGSMLPAKKAAEEGFDQLIWTDSREHVYVEELGAANIVFVIDGKMVTPSTRDTILKGVTRDSILALARSWNVPVEERRVAVTEVLEGIKNGKLTEAFGVGTAATITSIVEIGFNGEIFALPNPAKGEFAPKLRRVLDDIKYGRTEDLNNWNYIV